MREAPELLCKQVMRRGGARIAGFFGDEDGGGS